MESEESRKLKESSTVSEAGKGVLLYEPQKLSGSSLPSKDVGIKSTLGESRTFSKRGSYSKPISLGKTDSSDKDEDLKLKGLRARVKSHRKRRISHSLYDHKDDDELEREIKERLQAFKIIKSKYQCCEKIPTPMDTTMLSDIEIDMLTHVIFKKNQPMIKLQLVGTMLNVPWILYVDSTKRDTKSIFYLYNTSGRFSRTFLGDCLAAVCDDEIEMIHGILRNGKQDLTSFDNKAGLTTTERCLKESMEKSKTSECSHLDQITSISDTTPLSSLEMEVLAVYISESWESLAPMLDVDESNVKTIFDPDMVWSMEYDQDIQAVILLYLYNENDHFSRERLVQSCKKCGISDVKERLKRVHLVNVSLDDSKTSGSGEPSVLHTTRLLWWEIDEIWWYIRDSLEFAKVLPISINQMLDRLQVLSDLSREETQIYAYNESDFFSRKTLGKYLYETGRSILLNKSESMQNIRPSSSDMAGSKTRTEESSQHKHRRETTLPLESTLDSKRLSSPQIERLSRLVMYREWPSLACNLDVPIFMLYSYTIGTPSIVLSLYNKSRHFSRKKVVECCKKFLCFKEISEILSEEDDSATKGFLMSGLFTENLNVEGKCEMMSVEDDSATKSFLAKTLHTRAIDSSSEEEDVKMNLNKRTPCETDLQALSLQSSKNDVEESETSKSNIIPATTIPTSTDEPPQMYEIDHKTFQYVKARSLALRFMAAKPSCVRAVPRDTNCTEGHDSPAISMCLYMDTAGQGITDDFREEAKKYFSDYIVKFVDLECDPLGKYFSPRDCKLQSETHEMAKLTQIIEKNLPLFENRLNVTAVYPSYKISEAQETDDLCITVSVLGKGLIPVGENEFSKTLDGHPLDIVEGYFSSTNGPFLSQASPLHLGVGIGVRGKRGVGTLGAILTDSNDFYALSCQHVLSKENEKPAKKQPSRKQPAEEQTAENNYIDGVRRLENYISEKRESLVEKNREGPNELEKINVTKEIRALESVVRVPGEEEILIEQPAAEDFISEMYEMEKNIWKEGHALEVLENRARVEEWRAAKNQSDIQLKKSRIRIFESQLDHLTDFGLPRWIATYSYGLRQNYEKSGRKFFVDAAIAKINDDERDDILSLIQESGSVYGFDEQKKIHEKGEIVPLSKIGTGPERFWKAGRTTGHTEGGRVYCEHFYARLKGFNEHPCFGEFTNVKFQTYCKTCAPKTCDLVEVSLLKEVKCYKCGETLPKQSKNCDLWAYNCFLVYLSRNKPFSDEGDSGAVIFDEDGRAWGIIVGKFESIYTCTVAISLDIALEALKSKSGKELKLLCVKPQEQ